MDAPGRTGDRILPPVPAVTRARAGGEGRDFRLRWPEVSRRLLVTAGVFALVFIAVALFTQSEAFNGLNLRLLRYLQNRASLGQDVALGILTYLGSIEMTLVIVLLLGIRLFKGLRLLAILPAMAVLAGSGIEYLLKHSLVSKGPPVAYLRFPDLLPKLNHGVDPNSFPSGHVLRATLVYGLVLYLSERWDLFGKDTSRLSPVLVLLVLLMGYAVIYLGWHWFSDALGGLLLGLTLLIGMIAYLERKRLVNP